MSGYCDDCGNVQCLCGEVETMSERIEDYELVNGDSRYSCKGCAFYDGTDIITHMCRKYGDCDPRSIYKRKTAPKFSQEYAQKMFDALFGMANGDKTVCEMLNAAYSIIAELPDAAGEEVG